MLLEWVIVFPPLFLWILFAERSLPSDDQILVSNFVGAYIRDQDSVGILLYQYFLFSFFLQMNICNKPPNKTAPEDLGEAGPKVQRARRNGWSWPLHPFQIITWLLYLFFALVGFGILVPLLPLHWLPAGYIVSFSQEQNTSCNELPLEHFKTSGEHRRKQLSKTLFLNYSHNVDFLLSLSLYLFWNHLCSSV